MTAKSKKSLRKNVSATTSTSAARTNGSISMSGVMPEHFPALTGLRGLAAFAVFCMHAWYLAGQPDPAPDAAAVSAVLRWLFAIGWAGVDVFFTLSGFLLALPFFTEAEATVTTSRFFLRRGMRIFPAYYAQLILLFVAIAALPSFSGLMRQAPVNGELAAHLGLWFFAWPIVQPWMAPWWTLPVEMGFYLCLPFLVRLFTAKRWPWLLVIFALCWFWRFAWMTWTEPGVLQFQRVDHLPGRVDQFLIGVSAAWCWQFRPALRAWFVPRATPIFFLALIVVLALPALWLLENKSASALPSKQPLLLIWHALMSLALVPLIWAGCAAKSWAAFFLSAKPLVALGTVSYGLYLWHFPALVWVRSLMRTETTWKPEFWPFWLQSLLLSLLLATLSYVLIERPCLRRVR